MAKILGKSCLILKTCIMLRHQWIMNTHGLYYLYYDAQNLFVSGYIKVEKFNANKIIVKLGQILFEQTVILKNDYHR